MTAPRSITRLDQMRILASPLRQELLDVMARMGAVSLAEVGAVLGRPADGLYYHVRLLARAGLVKPAGTRNRGGRPEALFRAAGPEFALRYAATPDSHSRAVTAVVAAMMRLGARDFRRALAAGGTRVEGPARDLWALRTTGWLLPAHVRRVNALIRRLSKATQQSSKSGRLYGVTVLLTPLDHRSFRTGRRPRRATRP
jgi:hypothetical protein